MEELTKRVLSLAEKYYKYSEEAADAAISNTVRFEYATWSGLKEGYYCPQFADGIDRGKMIKRPRKTFSGFKYYFSSDGEICLIDYLEQGELSTRELMVRNGDCVYGFIYRYWEYNNSFCLSDITITRYGNGLVRGYIRASFCALDVRLKTDLKNNMQLFVFSEEYEYSDEPEPSIIKVISGSSVYRSDSDQITIIVDRKVRDLIEEENLRKRGESDEPIKFDNQKALAKNLKSKINKKMSLDEAIDAFFSAVADAEPGVEEMYLFEAGCCSIDLNTEAFSFSLVRQTPSEDGEYYQLYLDVRYEICDELKGINESLWHDETDGDLREYVLNSEAYKAVKDRKILKIRAGVDET